MSDHAFEKCGPKEDFPSEKKSFGLNEKSHYSDGDISLEEEQENSPIEAVRLGNVLLFRSPGWSAQHPSDAHHQLTATP